MNRRVCSDACNRYYCLKGDESRHYTKSDHKTLGQYGT
jgi:hypothetical protein